MLIVEFNGMPGSGKSTIAKALVEEFITDKRKIILFQKDILDYYTSDKKARIIRRLVFLRYMSLRELYSLFTINKLANNKLSVENLRMIYLAEEILCFYRHLMKKSGICIVEQGIIQTIISIIHKGKIEKEEEFSKNVSRIIDKFNNILYVNTELKIEDTMKRVKNRDHTRSSRLEKLGSDREVYNVLKNQNFTLGLMRKRIKDSGKDNIELNTYDTIDDNCAKLLDVVLKESV